MNRKLSEKIIKIAIANIHLPDSRFKHFTFIAERNNIICWGHNKAYKTHPLAARFKNRFNCIHSELDAIKNFPHSISNLCNYDLINIRILRGGGLGPAKPCISCYNLLMYFGVREIYYSTLKDFGRLKI